MNMTDAAFVQHSGFVNGAGMDWTWVYVTVSCESMVQWELVWFSLLVNACSTYTYQAQAMAKGPGRQFEQAPSSKP